MHLKMKVLDTHFGLQTKFTIVSVITLNVMGFALAMLVTRKFKEQKY